MKRRNRKKYFEMVDNNIAEHGFHVTYVLEEPGCTPFGYSTGLFKNFGIPEAFVSGLPNGLTNTLICNYAQTFKHNKVLLKNRLTNLIDRFPVYIISVENDSLHEKILTTFRFYENEKFKSVQIIFPDLNGKFPAESGYDYDQEIFGMLATHISKQII